MAPRNLLLARTKDILDRAGGRRGHIFNLGHGILPTTPEESRSGSDRLHSPVPRLRARLRPPLLVDATT